MVQTRYVLIALVLFLFLSCNHDVKPNDGDEKRSEDLNYEIITLTSEDELNLLTKRGDSHIVDWQLSKDYGCPIVYEGLSSSYTQDIKELYAKGKITQEDLPRLVDDGYPNVVIGKYFGKWQSNKNERFCMMN